MEELKDLRTLAAVNGHKETSLSSFMTKISDPRGKDETQSGDSENAGGDEGDSEAVPEVKAETAETTEEQKEVQKTDEQKFKVKGDKEVTLAELINAHETREDIHRRFTEADVKEKDIKARETKLEAARSEIAQARRELAVINEKFIEMREAVIEGKPLEALQIAMLMAQDGAEDGETNEVLEKLVKQAVAIADEFNSLDETGQKNYLDKEKIALREKNLKKQEKKAEESKKEIKLNDHFTKILEVNKVTDAEMDSAYEDIQKLPKFKEELDKKDEKGKMDYCAAWILGKRWRGKIEQGVAAVDKKAIEDPELMVALMEILDAKCTVEEVTEVYKNYLKLSTPEKESAKANSEVASTNAEEKSATSGRAPTEEKAKAENKPPIQSWADVVARNSN